MQFFLLFLLFLNVVYYVTCIPVENSNLPHLPQFEAKEKLLKRHNKNADINKDIKSINKLKFMNICCLKSSEDDDSLCAWEGFPRIDLWTTLLPFHMDLALSHFLTSIDLFWPICLGKIVFVTQDPPYDSLSYTNLYKLQERFPSSISVVKQSTDGINGYMPRKWPGKPVQYDIQQYVTFLADLHVDSDTDIIGIMDTDALFITPVTPRDLFRSHNANNNHSLGISGLVTKSCVKNTMGSAFDNTIDIATGNVFLNYAKVTNTVNPYREWGSFMATFPVFFYRDDFKRIRNFMTIAFRTNTSNINININTDISTEKDTSDLTPFLQAYYQYGKQFTFYSQFHTMGHIVKYFTPSKDRYYFDKPHDYHGDEYHEYVNFCGHNFKDNDRAAAFHEMMKGYCLSLNITAEDRKILEADQELLKKFAWMKTTCVSHFVNTPQELLATFDKIYNHISGATGYVQTLKCQNDHYDRIHEYRTKYCAASKKRKEMPIGCASWTKNYPPKYLSDLFLSSKKA